MPDLDKKRRIEMSIIGGFVLALIAMGLPMIGIAVNLWLGAVVLLIAFLLFSYGFWQWEKAKDWSAVARANTLWVLGLVYFTLIGWQIFAEHQKDHPPVPPPRAVSVRPIAVLEPLSAQEIRDRILTNPGNHVLPEKDYRPAWMVGLGRNGTEVLVFDYRNIGEIPARRIRQSQRVKIFDQNGVETDVKLPPPDSEYSLLYKDQHATYQVVLPSGTEFTGTDKPAGTLRITLLMTYEGLEDDPTVYYFKVVLQARRTKDTQTMNRHRIGGLSMILTDEGIVKNMDELLH